MKAFYEKIILFIGLLLWTACQSDSHFSTVASETQTTEDPTTVINFDTSLPVVEALSVVTQNGQNPKLEVSTIWDEYTSTWALDSGSVEEQKMSLLQKEKDQLNFLLTQFDPNDEDDAELYQDLANILQSLDQTQEIPIDSLRVNTSDLPSDIDSNPLISDVQRFDEMSTPVESNESETLLNLTASTSYTSTLDIDRSQCDPSLSPACDYINDGESVPDHGFIRVWSDGSFIQKFRLDKEAVEWFNNHPDEGVEIKTLFHLPTTCTLTSHGAVCYNPTRYLFECGDEWNTNMAGAKNEGNTFNEIKGKNVYRDTEAFDSVTSSEYRICSIGHLKPTKLKANKTYFIWRRSNKFDPSANVQITAQWVRTSETKPDNIPWYKWNCGKWTQSFCDNGDLAWCNCAIDTQWLTTFQYDNYPEIKVKWKKQSSSSISASSFPSSSEDESTETTDSEGSADESGSSGESTDSSGEGGTTDIETTTGDTGSSTGSTSSSSTTTANPGKILPSILFILLDDDD